VFGNRVVRRIFCPKREEITGGWSKLHNGDLHNLYSSSNIIRKIKRRAVRGPSLAPCRGEKGNACRNLVGKPKENGN
jgi:hypothetical protein